MPKKKELPFIFVLFAVLVLVVPFTRKFAPLFHPDTPKPTHIEAEPAPSPLTTVISGKGASSKDSVSPMANRINVADNSPTPLPSPQRPSLQDVLDFIDRYIALGNSNNPPFGRADVMAFPMENYMGSPASRQDWETRRASFNEKTPARHYERIGRALFGDSHDANSFSAIVPVAFSLKDKSGKILEGITFDRIGTGWNGQSLQVTSHENLCTRVTRTDGTGIASDAWRTGKTAPSRDGSTNIRYEDSDKKIDSIVKASPQGSPLLYLPQDERWLVIKDEEGIVGFMARNFVKRQQ